MQALKESRQNVKKKYEAKTRFNQQYPREGDARWKARQVQGILLDNDVTFETFCEVGCGTGEILVQLSEAFPQARFTGYDISPQALELARSCGDAARVNLIVREKLSELAGHGAIYRCGGGP